MVGLGWYLDVIEGDSQVLFWDFEDFLEKNHESVKTENLGKKRGSNAVA